MGSAPDWQEEVVQRLLLVQGVLLNPRRDHWDPSWPQDPNFQPFAEQVNWELEGLKRATTIACFLANGTISPVSLFEAGLYARSNKLLVGCERGFSRYGNVYLTCKNEGIPFTESLDELVQMVLRRL